MRVPLKNSIIYIIAIILLTFPPGSLSQEKQEKDKQKQKKKPPVITEEIVVVGKLPKDRPISTVTLLDATQIDRMKPLDLSEIIRYAPGVTVTFGDKSVYTLKLRGMDSNRIALLVDGIPVYEPYFSTFDLKTIAAESIDIIKLTKGPSSVLYGPNTLGGIVNVVTRRPSGKPEISMNASFGEKNTRSLGLNSRFQHNRLSFSGMLLYQDSNGFAYPDTKTDANTSRSNTDYQRFNLNTKLYYNPSSSSEILVNAGIYQSEYSMPPQLDSESPRYWRFKNWDRYSFNIGGFKVFNINNVLRFRGYFVQYKNTLDMFTDEELSQRRFESTHDNSVMGIFGLADIETFKNNRLKFSLNLKKDNARTQDDIDLPWNEFDQKIFSAGIEDHYSFYDEFQLVGGLSFDFLKKFIGKDLFRVNPLLGLKYSPLKNVDLHLSFSRKSRFPSMRAMYSGTSANPSLLSETGTMWELGFEYNRGIFLSGAIFLSRYKNLIDSVRLPQTDFQRVYFNIEKARINGFEIQAQKEVENLSFTLNYTFLDHWNTFTDRPLAALSRHNLNFNIQVFPAEIIRIGINGMLASSSSYPDFSTNETQDIPSYFYMDTILAWQLNRVEFFLKANNIFNKFIYTEPGFPWRGRYFEVGFRTNILN